MLKSDIEAFREKLSAQDKASIIEIAVENYSLRLEMEARLRVQEDVSKDMSQKYNGMRIRLNNAEKELLRAEGRMKDGYGLLNNAEKEALRAESRIKDSYVLLNDTEKEALRAAVKDIAMEEIEELLNDGEIGKE